MKVEAKIPTPTVAKEPARRGRPPKTKHSAPDDSTLVSQQSPSKDVLNPTKKLKMPETSGVLVTGLSFLVSTIRIIH
jgi:hypothetical protein